MQALNEFPQQGGAGYDANQQYPQQAAAAPAAGGDAAARPANSVKLFVGQIGRNADEAEIKTLLETYGQVVDVSIIKDKATMTSKGCAFVSMARRMEADAAIKALNGVHTMPGMANTVQLSYAKVAGEEERVDAKLFVGMISKTCDEAELRTQFAPYGDIEEVYLMKDKATGANKGCAFVKYSAKTEALRAIDALNGKITMPGNTNPLVVKWADPPKDVAKNPMMGNQGFNMQAQMMAQAQMLAQQNMFGMGGGMTNAWGQPAVPQPTMGYGMQGYDQYGQQTAGYDPVDQTGHNQYNAARGYEQYGQQAAGYDQMGAQQGMYGGAVVDPMAAYQAAAGMGGMGMAGYGMGGTGAMGAMAGMGMGMGMGMGAAAAPQSSRQAAGPANANLFIYHIPVNWSETELLQCFSPFGNVISATVFKDKLSGASKGFGFVSYDNAVSAANSIAAMNGMQIDGKRLKVEIKKPKGTPY